jgi:hypothetical protein
LRYLLSAGFERILRRRHPAERMEIQRNIDALVRAFEARNLPVGFGIKKMSGPVWEFRIDLATRILFRWDKQSVTFLFAGNHNEVRQFLKHYL